MKFRNVCLVAVFARRLLTLSLDGVSQHIIHKREDYLLVGLIGSNKPLWRGLFRAALKLLFRYHLFRLVT